MHPRQSITEKFSTFVQFVSDRFSRWAIESKLRHSIQTCIQRTPQETSESFWALYWYKFWLVNETQTLAKQHLIAYLQESCYWVAQKTVTNFASTQYQLSDCFQIAIAQIDKILQGFNPNQGFTLKNYASSIFSSAICETLRQRHEVDICTDWGLLRKISQKRLQQSLQHAGLSQSEIQTSIIAWNSFKNLYVPTATGSRKLSRPDDQTWEAIAKAYNSQTNQNVNPQNLEKQLLTAAKVARKYLYPSTDSLNIQRSADDSWELLDNIPGTEQPSLIQEIIAQEEEQTRTSQQTEINKILASAIAQLEPQVQQIFQLYYAQSQNQDKIAKQLDIKQYTVSRRLTKARETLLKSLANWSQETLHISITSDLLKNMSTVMEEWLQNYYRV